jgi:RNA polymerase sigma factor FliA
MHAAVHERERAEVTEVAIARREEIHRARGQRRNRSRSAEAPGSRCQLSRRMFPDPPDTCHLTPVTCLAESDADAVIAEAWREFKATASAAARDLLIIHYMAGHVRKVAHRIAANLPRQVDPDDLSQHVYHVLVRLMDRFDPAQDVQFETFATPRLSGAMRDYLRDLDTAGRQERQRCKKVQATVQRHLAVHGRQPDRAELKSLLGLEDDADLDRWLQDARTPATVSFASSGPADEHWNDVDGFGGMADPRQTPPPVGAEREDLKRWITEGLARRDRLIVILYYYEQMTMKEVGRTLGCSESRVSQRLESILQCLRARLTRLGTNPDLA